MKIREATDKDTPALLPLLDELGYPVSFKDFNKPVTVTEPENAMSLEELIAQVFGSFGSLYGTSSFKADLDFDASFKMGAEDMDMQSFVDADKDGLSDSMEKMYKTNPAKADTDGDGFTDYDEVMKGYNPAGTGKMPMDF